MNNRLMGIIILVVVALSAAGYEFFSEKSTRIIKGYIGGEKSHLLENEDIKKILRKKYGIVLEYAKAGSIEMVRGEIPPDIDFLWPSSQVALELLRQTHPEKIARYEVIFNSPIVLYTWDTIADAMTKNGIVTERGNTKYITDVRKLLNLVTDKTKWSDIGLNSLYGKVMIIPTDPTKSNSGNMFTGLMANILNSDVVEKGDLPKVLPIIKKYYNSLGYLEHSSSDLFEQYLRTGIGAKPVIAGYENQIIEFSLMNKELWPRVREKVRILYPEPTVWSSHPLIILDKKNSDLITALQDREIQEIAWEEHGFRTGLAGGNNDVKVLKILGIPETIEQVIPMPGPDVMEEIIKYLQN